MNTHADRAQENKSQSMANAVSQKQSSGESSFQFDDSRPEAIVQRKLQEVTDNSPQVMLLKAFHEMANDSPEKEKQLPHEGWRAVQQVQDRVKPTLQAKGLSINDGPALEREADLMGTKAATIKSLVPTSVSQAADAKGVPVQLKLVEGARYYAVDPSGSFLTTTFKKLINRIDAYNKTHSRTDLGLLHDKTLAMETRKKEPRRKQVLTILLDDINHELSAHQEVESETRGDVNLQKRADLVDEKRAADQGATVNAISAMGQGKGTLRKVLDKNWIKLAIEATGHLAMGVIGVAASGVAVVGTSGVLLFQGVAGILGGIGQMAIGVSKGMRAHLMRIGELALQATLTGFEATVGTVTSALGAVAGWGAIGPIVSGIAGGISNMIKAVRAYYTGNDKMPKWLRGVLVVLESVFGLLGRIGSAIANLVADAAVAVSKLVIALISELVLAVKGTRGIKMYDDAP